MKQISILAFFLVAFLGIKAQVNPETFPTVTPVETDNVYSQTGGVTKKFTVGAIARLARNGVNGQDSSGLGGSLNQNTFVLMGDYMWLNVSIIPPLYGGAGPYGLITGHQVQGCVKIISTGSFNNDDYNAITTSVDTCNGELHTELAYGNIATGKRKQFVAKHSSSQAGELFINLYNGDGSGGSGNDGINILFDDTNFGNKTAMRFLPENAYTGDILDVRAPGVGSVYKIDNAGKFSIVLPYFADDASAGVGGLIQGMQYQTDGTGASPLNVAGIVMIKQ